MKKQLLILPFLLLCISSNVVKSPNNVLINDNQHNKLFYLTAPDENDNINYEDTYLEEREYPDGNNEGGDNIPSPLVQKRRPPSNGDTSDIFTPNKNYMSNYFSHLNTNFPFNRLGICGYTAISMFLSYFDTYWNDAVIEEKYEQHERMKSTSFSDPYVSYSSYNSPGVYNNITYSDPSVDDLKNEMRANGITNEKSNEYKEALDRLIMREVTKQINDETFLGKLYEIAIENGSIKPHFVMNEYTVANSEYLDGIGVNNTIMTNVLCDYVSKNELLNKSVTITSSKIRSGWFISYDEEKARIRSEIVELIKSGKPVLMGGGGYTDSNNNRKQDKNESRWGHVVVAYEYDSINDIIYGNMGWGYDQTHVNLDKFFNIEMSDYWSFSFNSELRQNYTDHYYFYDKNANYSPFKNVTFNTLTPKEYGFPESYGGEDPIKSYIYIPSSENNNKLSFERLRTGFIEGECINLSPRKDGAGLAYLEYEFENNIKGLNIDLSFWSSKEFTNINNSDYRIEYNVNGNWFTAKDLWRDVTLSTDRNNPTNTEVLFAIPTTKFRFYATSLYTSDRNKGRLSIFDMMFFYA